jgi:hypothetical protein
VIGVEARTTSNYKRILTLKKKKKKKNNVLMASIIVLSSTDDAEAHHVKLDNKPELKVKPQQAAIPTERPPLISELSVFPKILGKGGFGTVRCCTSKRTKQMLAIKSIQLKGSRQAKRERLEACRREASIHALCSGDLKIPFDSRTMLWDYTRHTG